MQRIICGLTGLLWLPWAAAAQLHHALDVVLQPGTHSFQVMNTITLPEGSEGPLFFALHPGLQPEPMESDARLTELPSVGDRQPRNAATEPSGLTPQRYRVDLPPGQRRFTLRYGGRILHGLQRQSEEYARSFQQTHGMITQQGVFLTGAS